MLKLLGSVLVMAAALALGLAGRKKLADRVARLEQLKWEVGRLRARISSCRLSLEDCFMDSELFRPAAELLRNGATPSEAVQGCGLEAEGLALFSAGLDAETVEGQVENLNLFMESLESSSAAARDELNKKGRLYLGLGVLGGAAVCLILI